MPRKRRTYQSKHPIESYDHRDKERLNNPPVGLVTPETDRDAGRKSYAYDPHLDPQLQWAGKAEHTSFEVPTVSLHVHERIDPRTIIEATRKRNGNGAPVQGSLFELPEENPPVRSAIEFYRHRHNWTNRLVAGDSLLVMNSLLEKEGMAGKVQMVYIDPPYGIRYGSNFQPFVDKRDVKDGRDEDLTQEPETIKAFRDTWELGIHSYLSYLRDRLLLARELLTESGSCFVQISDENVHLVRNLMDEVFGAENFQRIITIHKRSPQPDKFLPGVADYLVWFSKDRNQAKYRETYRLTEYDKSNNEFVTGDLTSSHEYHRTPFEFEGQTFKPGVRYWSTSIEGLTKLEHSRRLVVSGSTLRYRRFKRDWPCQLIGNVWDDVIFSPFSEDKLYAAQTSTKAVQRCILMTTDPGDLVFDPTCGSGTTAYVAEQWGRRWITCDTSRVAISLAKQRLMTALYDYYQLAHLDEGVGSGFNYKTVPHVTLRSIVNNPDIKEGMTQAEIDTAIARHAPQETLYDQPLVDTGKKRVTGPFSVEAVPAPAVKPIDDEVSSSQFSVSSGDDTKNSKLETDNSIARSGETLRQSDWRDELLKTGIRGKAGQFIRFARLEPLPGYRYLHADGESLLNNDGADSIREGPARASQRVVISFGPDHAPLEQRQVNQALQEAETLRPSPRVIVFAAFQFDPEAAKDIDETNWPGITLLKAQMNADLLTEDLKRKRASNESFWLIGQPDVVVSSFEFLVSSNGRRITEYETFKKLSGLDRMEEVNRLGWHDLFFYSLLSQGRDVWDYLADQAGWDFHTGEYRRGAGKKLGGGVPAVSWNSARLTSGTGDLAGHLREFGIPDLTAFRRSSDKMRRDQQIARSLEAIAGALNFPIGRTENSKLKTKNWHSVAVLGFDYYNTKTGGVESGGGDKIAMWMLDPDYDGRSLYPRQVFFPMAGANDGWARLARNLKAEIDEDLIEAYRSTVSLPFEPEENQRIAVKIIDDRGIESLKVIELDAAPGRAVSGTQGRTLEEILADFSRNVPAEEWAKLPDDLIDNLDHYTSGADKDTERPKRTVEEILEDYAGRVPLEDWANLPPDLIERLDYYTSGADV